MSSSYLRRFTRGVGYGLGKRLLPLLSRSSAVLCFHAIGNDHPRHLTAERFRAIVDWMAPRYRVMTVSKLGESLPELEEPTVALTFDDAYQSQFEHALPVLDDYDAPGTFYVPTAYVAGEFPASDGSHTTMDESSLKTLAKEGHELGSHSHSHQSLTDLGPEKAREDLDKSRTILEDLSGSPVTSLAYPSGNYDRYTIEMTRASGFRTALTTRDGTLDGPIDPYEIPRITVSNQLSPEELKVKLSPLNHYVRKLGDWI